MLIAYRGPSGVRLVGPHRWEARNGFMQEIADAELAAQLLTQPGDGFVIAETEPLRQIVGASALEALLFAGVASVQDLADFAEQDYGESNDSLLDQLAFAAAVEPSQLRAWAVAARAAL